MRVSEFVHTCVKRSPFHNDMGATMNNSELLAALYRALDLAMEEDRQFVAWLISLAIAEAGGTPGVANDNVTDGR